MKQLNVMFIGAPGSGKGTQAKFVAERFSIPHVSTGDILRAELAAKTELGLAARSYLDAGHLVPDDVVMGIVKKRLEQEDCKVGYVFDGFPRTLAQAEALDKFSTLNVIIAFDLPKEILVKRISGRRVCRECGATYHTDQIGNARYCAKCTGDLHQRSDDEESTVLKRLAIYDCQTLPLLQHYDELGVTHHINGNRYVATVREEIAKIIMEIAQNDN